MVQEDFINNLYRKERRAATEDVDAAVTSHNYVRSLLQNSGTITKVLSNALEDRMTDVSSGDNKMDPPCRQTTLGGSQESTKRTI